MNVPLPPGIERTGSAWAQAWHVKDAHNTAEQREKEARLAERQRYKARRATEWRRTKTMSNLKQRIKKRIKKRIGFAS